MSPLIATVLLIAFAVALGAMIMSWDPGSQGCKNVFLESKKFCYDGNVIVLVVQNTGSQPVAKTALSYGETGQIEIPDSSISPQGILSKRIEAYSIVKDKEVGVLPFIEGPSDKLIACRPPPIKSVLGQCAS